MGASGRTSAVAKRRNAIPWWSEGGGYYNEDYLFGFTHKHFCEMTPFQVSFLQKEGMVPKQRDARILDCCCGTGRIALELARRGYTRVTGADINSLFLREARAARRREHLPIEFVRKDIRQLPYREAFDAVICAGSSVGHFSDTENAAAIGNLVAAMRPGGTIAIDIWNEDGESSRKEFATWKRRQFTARMSDGSRDLTKVRYNSRTMRAHMTIWRIQKSGEKKRLSFLCPRFYFTEELVAILSRLGCANIRVHYRGCWDWKEYDKNDDQARFAVVTAEKPWEGSHVLTHA